MHIIGGGGSTGTHLLGSILHNIEDIRVGPEIHLTHQRGFYDPATFRLSLFRSLIGANEVMTARASSGERYDILPSRVLDNCDWYNLDIEALFEIQERATNFGELINMVKARAAAKWGWPEQFTWVEHSPRNSIWAFEFLDTFEDARFIHLVRDGRDAMLSQARRFQGGRYASCSFIDCLRIAVSLWCLTQNGALRAAQHPRYLRIRYEDLVAEPVATCNQVLRHLGKCQLSAQQFDAHRQRSFPEFGFSQQQGWGMDLRGLITTKGVGRWKDDLDEEAFLFLDGFRMKLPLFDVNVLGFKALQSHFNYS